MDGLIAYGWILEGVLYMYIQSHMLFGDDSVKNWRGDNMRSSSDDGSGGSGEIDGKQDGEQKLISHIR